MNCKLIKTKVPYVDKKTNEEKVATNYYLLLENGSRIAVSPKFYTKPDGTTSSNTNVLNALAELVEDPKQN